MSDGQSAGGMERCPECGGRYPKKVDRLGYGYRECFECNHWERVVA